MADQTLWDLSELTTGNLVDADVLLVADMSDPEATRAKKILASSLTTYIGGGGAFTANSDTEISPSTAIVLADVANDEIALDLSYTTNKASGTNNDTGLRINQTDTASPGTSLLIDAQVGGTSKWLVDNAGAVTMTRHLRLSGTNSTLHGFTFDNDTDTGLYRAGVNSMSFYAGGVDVLLISSAGVVVNDIGSAALDFRVETDNATQALFIDAGAETAAFNVPTTITARQATEDSLTVSHQALASGTALVVNSPSPSGDVAKFQVGGVDKVVVDDEGRLGVIADTAAYAGVDAAMWVSSLAVGEATIGIKVLGSQTGKALDVISSSLTRRAYIESDGTIGSRGGTTTQVGTIEAVNSGTGVLQMYSYGTAVGGTLDGINKADLSAIFSNQSGGLLLSADAAIVLSTGSEALRIDTSQNVNLSAHLERSTDATLTASTTQTQAAATAITTDVAVFSTVANANDAGKLPTAAAGRVVTVLNTGANTLQLFPASGDNLGAGVDASTTIAASGHKRFMAYDATNWKVLTTATPSTRAYGEIRVESNASATTITTASSDFSNKVQVLAFDTNGISSNVTPDHTNDHITIDTAGDYEITAVLHCSTGAGGADTISFAIFKNNGATQLGSRSTRVLGSGGDVGSATAKTLATLSATDTIEVWIQNESDNSDITIQDATLTVVKID